jgi:hypothetical protein
VDLETAKAAGYWSARKPSEIPAAFSSYMRRQAPALIAPHLSPDGRTVSCQMHPDHPKANRKGRVLKWVSPPATAAPVILSCHPWTADEVRNGTSPLWACEGLTRGHALAPLGIPAVTYPGCWSWQKGDKALKDWKHTNLPGRLVYLVPDADHRTKQDVQKALAAHVKYLEGVGATVLLVRVPEVNGDPDAGLDDYIAAAENPAAAVEALKREARPFVPVDVGTERLTRSERLRRFHAQKLASVEELPASGLVDCNARKLGRYLAGVATPAHGKPSPRGYTVHPSFPQMAEAIRVGSYQTVRKALDALERVGYLKQLRKPRGSREASSYLLLYPPGVTQSVNIEGCGVGGEEGQKQGEGREVSFYKRESSLCLHSTHIGMKSPGEGEKLPALRNSKLVHEWERKDGRRVVVDSEYFKRYGGKGEEILRNVLDRGRIEMAELHERFGSKTSTPGRFFKTWVLPMLKDGVLAGDRCAVEASPDWLAALERVRERTDEEQDNRRQSKKYAERRKAYLQARDNPTEATPELAGPEKAAQIVAAAQKREHAARVEEQRRKVGTTAQTFLTDNLAGVSGFVWSDLRDAWRARGGRTEDLRRAVSDPETPYRFRRDEDGPLYVEERPAVEPETEARPERKPAEVVPINPDSVGSLDELENLTERRLPPMVSGIHKHGPLCDCEMCESPIPTRYASAYAGSGA